MNYQLSQDGKTIKGMPEMEKPKPPFTDEQFNKMVKKGVIQSENDYVDYRYEVDQYEKHIASLPTFNCHSSLSEKYEPGAVLVEGKDFELMDIQQPYYTGVEDGGVKEMLYETVTTAFPIAVREDDVSPLTNSPIGSSHWFNTHLGFIKRTGEYLQKHGNPPNNEVGAEWGKQLYERSEEILKWFHTLTPKQ